jgi:hypothetical protein
MDLAQEMNGCFFGASVFSGLLKANFNAHFWSTALAIVKEFKRVNLSLFGDKCADLWQALEPVFLRRVNTTSSEYLVIVHDYETGFDQDSDQSEGSQSQMSIRDLLFGSSNFRPRGRFGVLAWTSHIPSGGPRIWPRLGPNPSGQNPNLKAIAYCNEKLESND